MTRRKRKRLSRWNFWTPLTGTIYQIRVKRPGEWWTRCGYVGQTTQVPWTNRIADHLWGSHDTPAKVWADTVPGWGPRRNVNAVIAAGGARRIVWFPLVPLLHSLLDVAELVGIKWWRPCHNSLMNRSNGRRITAAQAKRQRRMRDVQRRVPALGAVARWVRLCRQLATAGLVVTVVVAVLMAVA